MGGIKNKQSNKLSNNKTITKGSQLPSFSQPSEMLTCNISNTRTSNWWSLYASKTIGSLRLVTLTKYLSIACLSLAILSTIGLNIISSYSNTKTISNAEEASTNPPSTLANTDPSAISLSFSNATGSCTDTSNPANICLSIPDGGGIATGGHTVTVRTPADATGYTLALSSSDGSTSLKNVSNPNANFEFSTIDNGPVILDGYSNQWGFALGDTSQQPDLIDAPVWFGLDHNGKFTIDESHSSATYGRTNRIDYGINVFSPSAIPAGAYSIDLVYTLTVTLPSAPTPTLSKLVLNDTALTGQTKEFALEGNNLSTAYDVWVDFNNNGRNDNGESAGSPITYPGTDKAETVISFVNPAYNTPGAYDIYVETYGGRAKLDKAYRVVKESICQSGNPASDCQVDIDAHMIPVKYTGGTGQGGDGKPAQWTVVSKNDTNNPGDWYDYSQKKWANAVTVKDYTKYQTPGAVIDEDDVLGYWVYIPRYAYEVQRRDATDHYVDGKYALPDNVSTTTTDSHVIRNDFIIQFEKASDIPKEPTRGCSTLSGSTLNAKDYRTECGLNRTYGSATGTTWATHPAFRWGTESTGYDELNGIWMGKFEQSGSSYPEVENVEMALVLPNQTALIQTLTGSYELAKSVGAYDPANTGGGVDIKNYNNGQNNNWNVPQENSHHLQVATSHMIKNSEWGAATYLTYSQYGAGVGGVQMNSNKATYRATQFGLVYNRGVTGCGPYDDNVLEEYTDSGTFGTQYACSTSNPQRAWNGQIGQKASTTDNWYGIYDMAGGVYDVVAGAYSTTGNYVNSSINFTNSASEPYMDIYREGVGAGNGFGTPQTWSSDKSTANYYNGDACTWETCGGDALYELNNVQSTVQTDSDLQSWEGDASFVRNSSRLVMFARGGSYDYMGLGIDASLSDYSSNYTTPSASNNVLAIYTRPCLILK